MNDIHNYLLNASKGKHLQIYSLVKNNGVLAPPQNQSNGLFYFLAKTVVGQQLSAKAARTIWNRVLHIVENNNCSVVDVFNNKMHDELKKCGISSNKIKAICEVKLAIEKGHLTDKNILNSSYDSIVKKVTSVWGVGQWSADMVAIFYCGLSDVFPTNDKAIQRGLYSIYDNKDAEFIVNDFKPYRSYLCRHIWKGLDDGIIK